MLAILLAASAAGLVPASADGALVLDGQAGAAGLRAFLTTAGKHTAMLSPDSVGRALRDRVGVDLLAEEPAWGLAPRGPRALVTMERSTGLSAPVADVKAARAALSSWLGPPRQKQAREPRPARERAGAVVAVAGSQRLLIASGPRAQALISALARPGSASLARDRELLARATGPAWLYLKGQAPLRASLFALDASATGLVARGLVTALRDPILQGGAPLPCDGTPPGCLRAGLGPSGRALLSLALARLQKPLPDGPAVVVRFDGVDAARLGDERSLPGALRLSAAAALARTGPALEGHLDLAELDQALARLTPIDALRGEIAAFAYAAHLLYGPLLRNAGPLTLTGAPSGKAGADLELRLPLR